MYIINLIVIEETGKAYKLKGGGWFPKSVIKKRDWLEEPYYEVETWFVNNFVEHVYNNNNDLTSEDKNKFISFKECLIKFKDLPESIKHKYFKYWNGCGDYNRTKLEHYNDTGSMTDIYFSDIY
jgi:hypothetical protein